MHKRKIGLFFILVVGIGLFTSISLTINSEFIKQFDMLIIDSVQGMISTPLTSIMLFITFLGSVKGVIIITVICAGIFCMSRNYLLGVYLIISVGVGAGAFNRLLKAHFHRDRPDLLRIVHEHGFSFPSGHAMGSVILFGGIFYVIYRLIGSNRKTLILFMIAGIFILSIGLSRIYLGVHYPSDIIAGYAAGSVWVVLSVIIFRLYDKNVESFK
ncbi:phosphatase PAP2 family protein [Bacillus sp. FSL K6-3431]|uniref:phosphatase PAP2 family protein n=1 Tax=Bacillus sp. FSL K6-3431 TaxID=2921500 RepID=UPI0030FB928B